ncbi:MAG: hypothetical protein WCR67_07735, partial [Bacilli bacterium]
EPNTYMTTDLMLRKGGNLTLNNNGTNGLYDTESATAVYWLKDSAKHILYNKANSNCVVGYSYGASIIYSLAPWRIIRGVAWGVVGVLTAADILYIALILAGKVNIKEKAIKVEADNGEEF